MVTRRARPGLSLAACLACRYLARVQLSIRERLPSAASVHDELPRARIRPLRSLGMRRPAPAGSSRLPRQVQGILPRAHRIRPALLPRLVYRARAGPAGRPAATPGAVHPVDAGDPPVQAFHRLPPLLRGGGVLPDLR